MAGTATISRKELPELEPLVPTADEWAEQVDHVTKTVGADHVAIGLDMAGGRTSVPKSPGGYPDLMAALNRITTPANVRKIPGENGSAPPARRRPEPGSVGTLLASPRRATPWIGSVS